MNNLKLREALKQAVRDLLEQGEFGAEKNSHECSYLSSAGNSCVIGLLVRRAIPALDVSLLNGTSYTVIKWNRPQFEAALGTLTTADEEVIRAMQSIHDAAVLKGLEPSVLKSLEQPHGGSMRELLMQAAERMVLCNTYGSFGEAAHDIYNEVIHEAVPV